jgi:hypothetical protein
MLQYIHIAYFVVYGMALLYVFASVYQELQLSCSWHWSCRMSKYLFLSLLFFVWGRVFFGKLYNHSAWQEIIILWILLVHRYVHSSPPLICILIQLNVLLIFPSVLLISTSVFSYLHLYVQGVVLPLGFGLKFCVVFSSHPFSCYMFCLYQPWYSMKSMTNEAPFYVISIYVPSLKFRNLHPFIFKLPQPMLTPVWSECLSFTPT